jgi:hypothetical protein
MIRGLAESDLESLRAHAAVQELRIRTPSLEEIFVAYLKAGERGDLKAATEPAERVTSADTIPTLR